MAGRGRRSCSKRSSRSRASRARWSSSALGAFLIGKLLLNITLSIDKDSRRREIQGRMES
jgi:hypothetical protein